MRNPSCSNQSSRRIRRGRITAALAAGVVTVVVGSIGTASADAPKGRTVSVVTEPEGASFRVAEPEGASFRALDTFGSGGGGRATFR